MDREIKNIAGAVVRNFYPRWDVFCGICWRKDSVALRGRLRIGWENRVAKVFYERGWQFIKSKVKCPACAKTVSPGREES